MKTIGQAIAQLLSVKSVVTVALTACFIKMSLSGTMTSEYNSLYLVVISFYFGTQHQKRSDKNAGQSDGDPGN